jgi:hypothetical protein
MFPSFKNVTSIHLIDGSIITPANTKYLSITPTYSEDCGLGIVECDCIWKEKTYKPFQLTLNITSILMFERYN